MDPTGDSRSTRGLFGDDAQVRQIAIPRLLFILHENHLRQAAKVRSVLQATLKTSQAFRHSLRPNAEQPQSVYDKQQHTGRH